MAKAVQAQFSYLEWQSLYKTEKPFELFIDHLPDTVKDQRRTNLVFRPTEYEPVTNVRGSQDLYALDVHGFAFTTHKTKVKDFREVETVEREYFAEMTEHIRRHVDGADKVVIFDWRVRLFLPAVKPASPRQ